MSSTSPFFNLVLATTSDPVNVVTHIANNFSSVDSILAVVHTGSGQLKPNLTIQNPTLVTPTVSGTLSANVIVGSTGRFNTITATGGTVAVNALTVGTYAYPTAIGNSGEVLTVVTGNAVFVAQAPGTGAAANLSNLASVAINTSLGTFSAGFVTVNRIISTSGALSGLTAFQSTTGTFSVNLTVVGTVNAGVINATGGAITAGGISIGTYSLPNTIGAAGQVLSVVTANAQWVTTSLAQTTMYLVARNTGGATAAAGGAALIFEVKDIDSAFAYNTSNGQLTVPASGYYEFNILLQGSATAGSPVLEISGSGGPYRALFLSTGLINTQRAILLIQAGSGNVYTIQLDATQAGKFLPLGVGPDAFVRSTLQVKKIPDA